jgi:hypothetical protein
MTGSRPLWRQAFDRAERAVGRPLEHVVAGRTFNDVFVLTFRAQGALYRGFQGQTRAVLHFWNLPARSDVTRLQRQVGALSAAIQELSARLEDQQRGDREPRPPASHRRPPS